MSEEAWTLDEAMAKLTDALAENNMTAEDLFAAFDTDGDGTINGPELHHGIKATVGETLSPAQISQIIQALDVNADHRIDLAELKAAFGEEEE